MIKISNLDKIVDTLTKYIDVRLEILKLQLKENAVNLLSVLIYIFILLTLLLSFLFFSAMALGLWLNYMLESTYLGFVIIAATYLIPITIALVNKGKIVRNKLLSSFFESALEEKGDPKSNE